MKLNTIYKIANTELVLDNLEQSYDLRIRDLPPEEKPRERLMKYGPGELSVSELLAVVLNVGTTREGVLAMSKRLLREYGQSAIVDQKSPARIQKMLRIPLIKACQVVACFELGRRFFKDTNKDGQLDFIRTAKQVYEYLKDMRELPKEHLRGLYLNSHHHLVRDEVISIGSLNSSIIHPREVFKPALEYSASAVILAHNHPSGITTPSEDDVQITKQLIEAGKILGIHLIDHIIITKNGFASVPAKYE
ncbi:MAG: DNA repair protein RadC [Parcubacteria group bacterium Gr01-1014_3]|nr:MAG: DNA repair protein RadC [Parcubacteria group bacterium Gr01-1014_3]